MLKLTDFLSEGESGAVNLESLSISAGLSERTTKKEVLQARLRGELILSDENGYYLPSCADDIRRYVRKRNAYLKTAHAALKPFIKAVKA